MEDNKTYRFDFNTGTYGSGSNMGDLVQNCIMPGIKTMFGDAIYKVASNNYPCILLPRFDGTFDERFNFAIEFALEYYQGNYTNMQYGVEIYFGMYDSLKSSFKGSRIPQSIDTNKNIVFAHSCTYYHQNITSFVANTKGLKSGVISFGCFSEFNNNAQMIISNPIGMNCLFLKCKKLNDNSIVDVVLTLPGDSSAINLYYPNDNGLQHTEIYPWNLPESEASVSMYQLNDGFIYHERIYICFPESHKILKGQTRFAVGVNEHENTWTDSPLYVDGKKFTLKCAVDKVDAGLTTEAKGTTAALLED